MTKTVRNLLAALFFTFVASPPPVEAGGTGLCEEWGYTCSGRNYSWKTCSTDCDEELAFCIAHCNGAPDYWTCEDNQDQPPSTGACRCEFPCNSF